jgi:hypothetical protein
MKILPDHNVYWSHLIPPEVNLNTSIFFPFIYPYWERDMDAGDPFRGKSQETSRQVGSRKQTTQIPRSP